VVIFADPYLEWPSIYGLGDPRRAPPVTLLDPLFDHWKVKLAASQTDLHEHANGHELSLMDKTIDTSTAGSWMTQSPGCALADAGFRLSCRIGKGRAELVADADLLDEASRAKNGSSNAPAVIALVESLAKGLPQSIPKQNQDQRKNKIPLIGRDDSNLREKESLRP
jgi:hypothetical protein